MSSILKSRNFFNRQIFKNTIFNNVSGNFQFFRRKNSRYENFFRHRRIFSSHWQWRRRKNGYKINTIAVCSINQGTRDQIVERIRDVEAPLQKFEFEQKHKEAPCKFTQPSFIRKKSSFTFPFFTYDIILCI